MQSVQDVWKMSDDAAHGAAVPDESAVPDETWGGPSSAVRRERQDAVLSTVARLCGLSRGAARVALAATLAATGAFGPASAGLALAAENGAVQAARAPERWEVQVGGDDMPGLIGTQAYFPGSLTVRAGDTVDFAFASFHTVTFNSNKAPRPLLVPGPNPGELTYGPGFAPAGSASARAAYDGTVQVSSGAPMGEPGDGGPAKFSVTFAKPGLFAYVCEIHPGMRGEIEVVPAEAPLIETPAQAAARGASTRDVLVGKMKAGVEGLRSMQASRPESQVHTALAGVGDAFGVSALQFVGGDLKVKRGDTVVWSNADPFEVHTVTFTGGGTPPEAAEPRGLVDGQPLIVMPASVASPAGKATYTGQGYANSGLLLNGSSYALTFDAPAGSYAYLCAIHPFMQGTVTVTE